METRSVNWQSVSKQFGGSAALQDVALHFEPGAVPALVGAGRSLFLTKGANIADDTPDY